MGERIAVVGKHSYSEAVGSNPTLPIFLRRPMDTIITDQKLLALVSRETTWGQVEELKLKERLKEAMKGAWIKGCGLAAIQIGIPLRYAWYRIPGKKDGEFVEVELLNPKILTFDKMAIMPKEGCLSIPNTWSRTKRFSDITLENDGKKYAVYGIEAFIVQHEVDHMDGILNLARRCAQFPKIGRNELCPCGSGKKYKHCCNG